MRLIFSLAGCDNPKLSRIRETIFGESKDLRTCICNFEAVVGRLITLGDHVEQVTLLEQKETVYLDGDRLEDLYTQLGDAGAENVVCRALEELAARMSHTERCFRQDSMPEMRKNARSLIAISEQLGMDKLAMVARDVIVCIDDYDKVAIAATLGRLLRVGETSLYEIWDLQDYSI